MTTKRFGITACSESKRGEDEPDREFPARKLYDSWLFDGRVDALETHCEDWVIFSAEHGCLEPDEPVSYYDRFMGDVPEEERLELARDVVDRLPDDVDEVLVLMGRKYADPLFAELPDDVDVWDPLEGIPLFDQRSALADLARETEQSTLIPDGGFVVDPEFASPADIGSIAGGQICHTCGERVGVVDSYCRYCGTSLRDDVDEGLETDGGADDPELDCPACDEPLPRGAEFCPYCATPLDEERDSDRESPDSDDESEAVDEETSEYQQVHWSDETDEWSTPPSLLRPLDETIGGFDLDPCSGAEERSIAPETYDESDDGLSKQWYGRVWVNPPYSDVKDWLEKSRIESARDDVELVLVLVPARTSTQWFHGYAVDATALCFLEGRLRFGNASDDAPFPSMLLAYGDVSAELYEFLVSRGTVYVDGEKYEPTRQIELGSLAVDGGSE